MRLRLFAAFATVTTLAACGASDGTHRAASGDSGVDAAGAGATAGRSGAGGLRGAGGTASGGKANSGGANSGGANSSNGGSGNGGSSSGGSSSGGTDAGALQDASAGDASPDASSVEAGTDASSADAGTDTGVPCCAADYHWAVADGVLPSADCPPWELHDTTGGGGPTLDATGVTLATVAGNRFYMQSQPGTQAGDQVRIAFRMRMISSTPQTPSRAAGAVNFAFGAARLKNSLFIGEGEIFVLSAENTRGQAASVATSDAMHDYVIDVDNVAGTVSVSYDGTPTLTGTLFVNAPDTTTDYILWGEASIYATGSSVWSRFEHDAWPTCAPPA